MIKISWRNGMYSSDLMNVTLEHGYYRKKAIHSIEVIIHREQFWQCLLNCWVIRFQIPSNENVDHS